MANWLLEKCVLAAWIEKVTGEDIFLTNGEFDQEKFAESIGGSMPVFVNAFSAAFIQMLKKAVPFAHAFGRL